MSAPHVAVFTNASVVATEAGPLGDGRIDNIIISSSFHLVTGMLVLITMTLATVLVARHAARREAIARPAQIGIASAQTVLAVQVLLGIKLLDQGQGIMQLYIHYVGGLIPLGVFLVAGWFARGDSGKSSLALTVLLVGGNVSAYMAFFIGRAFANQ